MSAVDGSLGLHLLDQHTSSHQKAVQQPMVGSQGPKQVLEYLHESMSMSQLLGSPELEVFATSKLQDHAVLPL